MSEMQGNIIESYCSYPIMNSLRSQLNVVKYLLDLQVIDCMSNVGWWKKVGMLKLWRMNYE